jgi:hypothetical protein
MTAIKYRHTLVYRIDGLTLEAQEEAEVISDPAKGFRAVLTTDPDPHCFEADRFVAVSNVRLNAVFGQSGSGTFDERLTSELEEIKGTRERKFGNGP